MGDNHRRELPQQLYYARTETLKWDNQPQAAFVFVRRNTVQRN